MVTIPQIRANQPGSVSLGQISVPSVSVSNDAAGLRGQTQDRLRSIFDYAGNVYEQKQQRMQRIAEMTSMSNENIAAAEFSQSVLRKASDLPIQEREAFISNSMNEYHDEVMSRYDSESELGVRIHDSLQQRMFRMENEAFSQAEAEQQGQARANLSQNVDIILNDIIGANGEAERVGLYQQLDDAIESASSLGFITPESGQKLRVSTRERAVSAIVGRHITAGQFSKAALYMRANEDMLSPEAYTQFERQIQKGAEMVQRRAVSAQRRAVSQRNQLNKYAESDPARYAIEAMGIKPNDPVGIYRATGGQSVMTKAQAKDYAQQIKDMPASDFIAQMNMFKQSGIDDAVMADLARAGIGKEANMIMQLASSENPDMEMIEIYQSSLKIKKGELADQAGFTEDKTKKAIMANPKFSAMLKSYSDAGVPLDASVNFTTESARAIMSYAAKNPGMSPDEAVDRFLKNNDRQYIDAGGTVFPVPESIDSANFRKGLKTGVETFPVQNIFTGTNDTIDPAIYKKMVSEGRIKFAPMADGQNKRVKMTFDGKTLFKRNEDGTPGDPITFDYDGVALMGEMGSGSGPRKNIKQGDAPKLSPGFLSGKVGNQ